MPVVSQTDLPTAGEVYCHLLLYTVIYVYTCTLAVRIITFFTDSSQREPSTGAARTGILTYMYNCSHHNYLLLNRHNSISIKYTCIYMYSCDPVLENQPFWSLFSKVSLYMLSPNSPFIFAHNGSSCVYIDVLSIVKIPKNAHHIYMSCF